MRPPARAWLSLAGFVAAADAWLIYKANRTGDSYRYATMSNAFGEALAHPKRRWYVIVSWGVLTAHLFGRFLPRWTRHIDPIGLLANTFARWLGQNRREAARRG